MNAQQFTNLIQLVTGRDFKINTEAVDLLPETEYTVYRTLPLTNRHICFNWKTPKVDEKFLRSFITAFTSKYREPNPANYKCCAPYFSKAWDDMEDIQKEYAYHHHSSNMYSKKSLLEQVEANFANPQITAGLVKYGFYPTEYGIGIFCFWFTDGVEAAIIQMKQHLQKIGVSYSNEFSDARWVFRFKLGISKNAHTKLLSDFS